MISFYIVVRAGGVVYRERPGQLRLANLYPPTGQNSSGLYLHSQSERIARGICEVLPHGEVAFRVDLDLLDERAALGGQFRERAPWRVGRSIASFAGITTLYPIQEQMSMASPDRFF